MAFGVRARSASGFCFTAWENHSVALLSERSGLRRGLDRARGLWLVASAAAAWQSLVGLIACGRSLSRANYRSRKCLVMFLARALGTLPWSSLALEVVEFLRNSARFAAAGPFRSRYACQCSRAYSSPFCLASANFVFFLHFDFDSDNLPAQISRRRSSQLHTLDS